MYYCYIKRSENVLEIIRVIHLTSPGIRKIMSYATRRNAVVYDAHESHWDNAVAFNLYPCIEFDGREFITIHEPD